jgi:hypothetical protein
MSLPGHLDQLFENNRSIIKNWKQPISMEEMRKSSVANRKATFISQFFFIKFDQPTPLLIAMGLQSVVWIPGPSRTESKSILFSRVHLEYLTFVISEVVFGFEPRFGVFRNAGGRVTEDTIRTVAVAKTLADAQVVVVLHHTGE